MHLKLFQPTPVTQFQSCCHIFRFLLQQNPTPGTNFLPQSFQASITKKPQTRWWLINNTNIFLIVVKAGKSKFSKALADSVSDEDPFPGSQTAIFLLCPHMVEGHPSWMSNQQHPWCCFYEDTNPIGHLPVAPPPNTITLGVRISTQKKWGK